MKDGKPVLMRLPKVSFIDDGSGKAVGIERAIGKRPYATFGNSDGGREMLEWTSAGKGTRLRMLVHHDDAQREYAYGPAGGQPDTKVGMFSEALMTEAKSSGWSAISMKNDWNRILPFKAAAKYALRAVPHGHRFSIFPVARLASRPSDTRVDLSRPTHSTFRSTRESPERPGAQPRAGQSRNAPPAVHAEPHGPPVP